MNTAANPSPAAVQPGSRARAFVCPVCRGSLQDQQNSSPRLQCVSCGKSYPSQGGIPDFRIFPDPFLSLEEDRERTDKMLQALDRCSFPELLEYYWSLSDITPQPLREKFVRSGLLGEARARRILTSFTDGSFRRSVQAATVLEIGSGTGNFLAASSGRFDRVIGVDIGMRHLHVSRRRFMDLRIATPELACCCAEHLPFSDRFFDLIVTSSTLEFARDPNRFLSECARTLKPGGALYVQTVNRYALNVDPYAYVLGVGFLPRRWQARYVRWKRNASYENVRTLSLRELKQLAGKHFRNIEVALPDVASDAVREFSRAARFQIRLYKLFRNLPVARALLKAFGPGWEVLLSEPFQESGLH